MSAEDGSDKNFRITRLKRSRQGKKQSGILHVCIRKAEETLCRERPHNVFEYTSTEKTPAQSSVRGFAVQLRVAEIRAGHVLSDVRSGRAKTPEKDREGT